MLKKALEVISKIVKLRETYGITVLLSEQNARRALEHGDRSLLLISGRVMYDDEAKKLLQHPELGKIYLGIKMAKSQQLVRTIIKIQTKSKHW